MNSLLVLVVLIFSSALPVYAKEDSRNSKKARTNFVQLDDSLETNLKLFVNAEDLNHDLSSGDVVLRVVFDGQGLLREKTYPQNIKIEASILVEGEKKLLTLANRTIKNQKAAKNIFLALELPRIEETSELIFDIYDSHNVLHSTFIQEVSITSVDDFQSSLATLPDFHCTINDGVCLIEYILRHVTFSANFNNSLVTTIHKNDKGRYFVNIPIKKGRRLGKNH